MLSQSLFVQGLATVLFSGFAEATGDLFGGNRSSNLGRRSSRRNRRHTISLTTFFAYLYLIELKRALTNIIMRIQRVIYCNTAILHHHKLYKLILIFSYVQYQWIVIYFLVHYDLPLPRLRQSAKYPLIILIEASIAAQKADQNPAQVHLGNLSLRIMVKLKEGDDHK